MKRNGDSVKKRLLVATVILAIIALLNRGLLMWIFLIPAMAAYLYYNWLNARNKLSFLEGLAEMIVPVVMVDWAIWAIAGHVVPSFWTMLIGSFLASFALGVLGMELRHREIANADHRV
jgi:hypothetical protein